MAVANRADDVEPESGLQSAAADGSADQIPVVPAASCAQVTGPAFIPRATGPRLGKKRRDKPEIDLDDHIRKAQMTIKIARTQVREARLLAEHARRKKQRLVRKASTLNVEDLERMAVLKRCGLHSEQSRDAAAATAASSAASAELSRPRTQTAQVTP